MVDYARIDIFRDSSPISTLENILDGEVRFTLGRANKFEIIASNEAAEYISPGFLQPGDTVDIYMGQDDDYSKILSGTLYKIEMPEDKIILSGFDWTDFLVGPKVSRRYEYRDYGYILRDLIGAYAPKLSTNYLLDSNQTVDGEHISRYDDLIETIEGVLDTIGYGLIVKTDKEVLIFPKEEAPIFLDSFKTTLASNDTTWIYPSGWSRDESNHIVQHTTIADSLYGRGIRKTTTYSDMIARCNVKFTDVTGGARKWAGLSLKGDGEANALYGYLDQANQKLSIGTPNLFGYPTKGVYITDPKDTLYGTWFSCPSQTTIGSISVKIAQHQALTPNIKCAIYKKSDNSLVGYTEEWTLTSGWDDWKSLNMAWGGTLEAEDYYLVHWASDTALFYRDAETGKGGWESSGYNSFPASWNPSTFDGKISIYCGGEPLQSTDLTIDLDTYYPLKVEKDGSNLIASVGATSISTIISDALMPTGNYVAMDADIKADFDDYGLYTVSTHSLTENDLYDYDITDDLSDISNRIIVIGGNETKYDGFDSTLTLDRWTIPSGSTWAVSEGYISPTTASYLFGGNQYWSYLDYSIDALFNPDETYDFFYRRTSSSADHNDGFCLRVANSTLSLICATDGTIASHTLSSPPSSGAKFNLEILANKNLHEVYFDNIRRIEAEDEHFSRGFIGVYATTGAQIDLINCKSDKKIIASAQDTSLYNYGLKEEVLSLPKIRDRGEALSKAALELTLKKIKKTSGKIIVPGDYIYSIGDTISLDLPESLESSPREYLVLDVKQKWMDNEYLTELKIAEKIAGIEELIRRLRKETRGLAVRELDITDLIGSAEDSMVVLADESTYTRKDTGTFRLDEAQIGVSDLG